MALGKKTIVCKLGDSGEARSKHLVTNALIGKNLTTAQHSWPQSW